MRRLAFALVLAMTSWPALAQAPGTLRACAVARSTRGHVYCSLFARADGFPSDHTRAFRTSVVSIPPTRRAVCVFENVPPGRYSVAVFHDENDDGRMDTDLVGTPREGWGVSRNAAPHPFGPPSFDEAAVTYPGGDSHLLYEIRLRY